VDSVILDGELLVYDEQETKAGAYDELGSRPGIQAFGTIFWLRQTKQGAPSRYGRPHISPVSRLHLPCISHQARPPATAGRTRADT